MSITVLNKKSASTFVESAIFNNNFLLFLILKLRKTKTDRIIVSENHLQLILSNKTILKKDFKSINFISYDGLKEQIIVSTQSGVFKKSLKAFRITYEEGKELKSQLLKFNSNLNNTNL
ncbi:hypothetical protein ACFO5T_01385 [Dokdonia genika]|uniref:YokE-like PH domain-containing protein n=1 Tax=Dokdonia genika TaxID=308113 RepID=A0ABV9L7G2_9FLAO